jgi:hypothetical protein
MGLKGFRLWDTGQMHSTCSAPPRASVVVALAHRDASQVAAAAAAAEEGAEFPSRRAPDRCVALQVAFERQILKPVFHSIGYRLWV